MPEPLIYQALEAFMEIYEDMWKYVECDDSKLHFVYSSYYNVVALPYLFLAIRYCCYAA